MVIRIENELGQGPYTGTDPFEPNPMNRMIDSHLDTRHPNPVEDFGIGYMMRSNDFCGFATYEQFIEWFTAGELRLMAKHGFRPVLINTQPTVIGEKQCLFVRD